MNQLPCETCRNSESISSGHFIPVASPTNKRIIARSDTVPVEAEIALRIFSDHILGETIKKVYFSAKNFQRFTIIL